MKKMLHIILGLSIVLLVGCEKSTEELKSEDGYLAKNVIQLDNLQVGQKSTYIKAASCQHQFGCQWLFGKRNHQSRVANL
jgi:hypothetical protein